MKTINYKLINENKELLSRNERNNFDKLTIINDAIARFNDVKFKYDILSTLHTYNHILYNNNDYISTDVDFYTKEECNIIKIKALKKLANLKIKFELYSAHLENKINKILKKRVLKFIQVDKKLYHDNLSRLSNDYKAFLYDDFIADKYYLVYSGDVVGGFCVNKSGILEGLFTLIKGIGSQVFAKQIELTLDITKEDKISLFCIGNFLKEYYIARGFKVDEVIEFDKTLASHNWNYSRFGTPNLYNMSKTV